MIHHLHTVEVIMLIDVRTFFGGKLLVFESFRNLGE